MIILELRLKIAINRKKIELEPFLGLVPRSVSPTDYPKLVRPILSQNKKSNKIKAKIVFKSGILILLVQK